MLQNAARGTARHIAIAKGDYIARNARVPHIAPQAYRAPQGHIPAVPNARSAIHDRRSIHACLHAIHDGEAVNSFVLFVPMFFVGDGVLDVPSRCSRVVPHVRMRETPFTTALPSNHSFPTPALAQAHRPREAKTGLLPTPHENREEVGKSRAARRFLRILPRKTALVNLHKYLKHILCTTPFLWKLPSLCCTFPDKSV